jgi:formaldehyde-activating enzyme involved in methanogenesis
MNMKILSGVFAIAIGGAASTGIAQAATESTESTTIERSTTVDVPVKPSTRVEETTTTKSKHGLFGRKKESTSSTTTYDSERAPAVTNSEFKSKTTVETERSRY